MPSQAQVRATMKFNKKTYKRFELVLRKIEDKELIEHLEQQPSRNDYIRKLIAKDLQSK